MQTLTEAVMTHRCTIERVTQPDKYTLPTWATFLEDQACFLYSQRGDVKVAPERTAAVDEMRLMVPKGLGIVAGDRVTSVTRDGTEILGGTASLAMDPRDKHDHDELALQLVGAA